MAQSEIESLRTAPWSSENIDMSWSSENIERFWIQFQFLH